MSSHPKSVQLCSVASLTDLPQRPGPIRMPVKAAIMATFASSTCAGFSRQALATSSCEPVRISHDRLRRPSKPRRRLCDSGRQALTTGSWLPARDIAPELAFFRLAARAIPCAARERTDVIATWAEPRQFCHCMSDEALRKQLYDTILPSACCTAPAKLHTSHVLGEPILSR